MNSSDPQTCEAPASLVAKRQILGYLNCEELDRFRAYALSLGLDPAALLSLLWQREFRVGRLGSEPIAPAGSPAGKVVMRCADEPGAERIRKHAESLGVGISAACRALVRWELEDEWLENLHARSGNGEHLHLHSLVVHVSKALFGRVAQPTCHRIIAEA